MRLLFSGLDPMHAKILRAVKVLSLTLIVFALGTLFGLREGEFAFYVADAVPKGVLAMAQLKELDKGNLNPARMFLNADIDQGLYQYSIAQEAWWFTLLKLGMLHGSHSYNADLITSLAKYRKQNPAREADPAIFDTIPRGQEGNADMYADMAAAHRDRLRRIKSVVETYAIK